MEMLLSPYRVLDLTDERSLLCGRILADLGATVIHVEPPGGSRARKLGPFYKSQVDPESSLFWWAYGQNQKSITLNLEKRDGQALLKRLVLSADFFIESFPPGYLGGLGLGYDSLSEVNPRLIMTSITGFGQDGPYRDWKAPDLVVEALGGMVYPTGDPDRPPMRMSFPQSYHEAALEALVGILIAHHYRLKTGAGQYVDVSAQQSVAWDTMSVQQFWDLQRVNLQRYGSSSRTGNAVMRWIYPCQGGWVCHITVGGPTGGPPTRALVEWLHEEGLADELLLGIDWANFDFSTVPQETMDRIQNAFAAFFFRHTKDELYEGALRRRILLYPVSSPADLLNNRQLHSRDYFIGVANEALNEAFTYPGAFAKFSKTPISAAVHAPRIGQHNEAVYCGELGLSAEELAALRASEVI